MSEKGPTTGTATPVEHTHNPVRRLRHFFRPDGRRVHIAHSPDEAEKLKRRLSVLDEEFDLVIHGSDEHVELLRATHTHHEEQREQLRARHGDEIANEFERVIRDLDSLAHEINEVSTHAVQLDANFEKFGYSAHLRTRDSPNASSANSLSGDSHEHDWDAERSQGGFMRFFQKPVVRQYFHKGLLWRASALHQVASYELFVDLLYVGIIDISGELAAEHPDGISLLRFAITFIIGYKFWMDIGMVIGVLEGDDILRRLSVLFVLVCLLGFTTNIAESINDTYTPLIAFFVAARMFGALFYAMCAYMLPMVRAAMIGNVVMILVPTALWIGSIHTPQYERQGLIWVAIVLDIFVGIVLVFFYRGIMPTARLKEWSKRTFEFFPAMNIEHRIERTGAFVTLVFGYSILSILYQSKVAFGINAFFGKAVLGLIQAFAFNWIYFEMDSFNLHKHAIRRHFLSSVVWHWVHLPFIMGFVLASGVLAKLVLAHDSPDSDYHSLTEHYEHRSEAYINDGQRWFYCAGLSVALAGMGIISLCHDHKIAPGQRLTKWHRLTVRFVAALAILLLPLAGSLNSLDLVAITTGLVVLVLVVELVGSTCVHSSFWWHCRGGDKGVAYSAKCKLLKKDLAETLKAGEVVKVEELAKREKDGQQYFGGTT